MIVDLITEHPQMWEKMKNDVTTNGFRDHHKMVAYFKKNYGLNVSACTHDLIGRLWVDEQDWMWFLLRWDENDC